MWLITFRSVTPWSTKDFKWTACTLKTSKSDEFGYRVMLIPPQLRNEQCKWCNHVSCGRACYRHLHNEGDVTLCYILYWRISRLYVLQTSQISYLIFLRIKTQGTNLHRFTERFQRREDSGFSVNWEATMSDWKWKRKQIKAAAAKVWHSNREWMTSITSLCLCKVEWEERGLRCGSFAS